LPLLVLGMLAPSLLAAANFARVANATMHAWGRRVALCPGAHFAPAAVLAAVGLAYALRAFFRLWDRRRGPGRSGWFRCWPRFYNSRAVRAIKEAWPRVVTTMVFTLHALLPAISMYSAVSMLLWSILQNQGHATDSGGWDPLHRICCFMLGLYGLCSAMMNHVQMENPEIEHPADLGTLMRCSLQSLHFALAAARGLCVLAAWTYLSLALDMGATWLWQCYRGKEAISAGTTLLGVVGPLAWLLKADVGTSPLQSDKAFSFSLNLISMISQQRLVEVLGRREVLLRLIGAERVMASTLCLLLKGVAVACSTNFGSNPMADFLTSVAPPQACCMLIVTLRSQALVLGATLKLAPRVLASGELGSHSSFIVGILAGVYITQAVLRAWFTTCADIESPALRLALLVPGVVSGRAKGLLRGALAGARTRAVQMMTMGILQRAYLWCTRQFRA